MLKKFLLIIYKKPIKHLIILLGSAAWSLTMVKSGLAYSYGIGFWGPNGHDGIWHIALARSLASGTWQMPIFAGEEIKNYHLGFDLILAALHKLTLIPVSVLYFQIIPPLMALSIGYAAYAFIFRWRKSELQSLWGIFFVYFGGSFGWIISWFRNRTIDGESLFWSQQSVSTLVNPPYALSLLVIFVGLYFLISGKESKNTKYLTLATFFFGVLVQIKVYAGILVLLGLFASALVSMIKNRDFVLFKVATGSLILSILFFSSVRTDVNNTIIFKPLWFVDLMVSSTDRLYWPRFSDALLNYKLAGNFPKLFLGYAIALQ